MPAQNESQAPSTPGISHTDERKRKRDVLSCLECRRRKVKCDRGFPTCIRCVKGGIAAACTYKSPHGAADSQRDDASVDENGSPQKRARGLFDPRPVNELVSMDKEVVSGTFMHSALTLSTQSNVIKSLGSRLAALESILAQDSTAGDLPLEGPPSISRTTSKIGACAAKESGTFLFKGYGLRTQFYGPSNPTSLLAHFPEVRIFMKEAHTNSNLQRLQNECNSAHVRLKESLRKAPPTPQVNLLGMVPERPAAEPLVRLYFDTFEMTYRILHRPTFWRDYESFWQAPEQAPTGFVPILLLVMAIVRCMSPREPLSFNYDGSTLRTEAIQWIQACDVWLMQQSQKHRFLAMYQVMCLRILAASANSLKTKEAYVGVENMLNYFRAAGLHRSHRLLEDRCSPYETEMRRRLWATAMEFELQGSIDRGMPPSVDTNSIDCLPPLNVNDDSFAEDSALLPTSNLSEQYTEMSFLEISSKSLPFRLSLCSMINSPNSSMQFSDALKYEQRIHEALAAIPEWSHETTQVSTLLDLQLRQFLLLIYASFARQTNSSHCRYSRMVCFETAKHILNQHFKLISSNNFTISLIRDDPYRAALSICHNAFLCAVNPNIFFQGVLMNFSTEMDEAFKVLEEKCMRRGEGFQYYWHVSAAFSLVQLKLGHDSSSNLKVQATDRIAKLYHKVLRFQEGRSKPLTTPAALPRLEGGFNAPGSWVYGSNALEFTNDKSAAPYDYLDAFDYSDWTLDNLWPLDARQIENDVNFLA